MKNPIFITGTDTDVGKSYVATLLLEQLNRSGISAIGYKPVASGAIETDEGMRNPDALALFKASDQSQMLSYDSINPYFFEEANAPHLLSRQLKRPIDFNIMREGANQLAKKCDQLIIEGAGGWFTPLSDEKTFADWVIENNYSVIVVVGLKLGCINHALLTFQTLKIQGLHCIGWIANYLTEGDEHYKTEYIRSIETLTDIPLLGSVKFGEAQSAFHLEI